jgi:hypothetical protein
MKTDVLLIADDWDESSTSLLMLQTAPVTVFAILLQIAPVGCCRPELPELI